MVLFGAHLICLMPVSISFLSEYLITRKTVKRFVVFMSSDVIPDVANFVEFHATKFAS